MAVAIPSPIPSAPPVMRTVKPATWARSIGFAKLMGVASEDIVKGNECLSRREEKRCLYNRERKVAEERRRPRRCRREE